MNTEVAADPPKQPYQTPKLEEHPEWRAFTGNITSNGIGVGSIYDPSQAGEQ
jgi:hypothetical protein